MIRKRLLGAALFLAFTAAGLFRFEAPIRIEKDDSSLQVKDGALYKGAAELFSGVVVEHFANGDLYRESQYQNGKLEGTSKEYSLGHILREVWRFHDGKKDGEQDAWFAEGPKRFEFHFKAGFFEGLQTEWHLNGHIFRQTVYAGGVELKKKILYPGSEVYSNYVKRDGRTYGLDGGALCLEENPKDRYEKMDDIFNIHFYFSARSAPLPFFDKADMTPYWATDKTNKTDKIGKTETMHTPASVTTFKAVNQAGQPITDAQMKGRVSLVNFFFAECPSACPMMMKALQAFKKELHNHQIDNQVDLLSFSVQPNHDTPEKLTQFGKAQHLDLKNWSLLTGEQAEIFRIGKSIFKADRSVAEQRESGGFIHSQNIWLVDSELRIRGIYNSVDAKEMNNLIQDISSLTARK